MDSRRDQLRLILSWLAIFWERLWRALWPAVAVALLFVALSLFDIPAMLPPWLHFVLLIAVGTGLVAALLRGLRRLRLPSGTAAVRRLQRINGLKHRPLEALNDDLAPGIEDPRSRVLWHMHQERMRAMATRLRVGLPKPRLIRLDPWAFRTALAVVLTTGLIAAGADAPARFERSLVPKLAMFQPPKPAEVDAWITPPSYTGAPPVFLTGPDARSAGIIEAPAGSVLAIRISGGDGKPTIARTSGQTPTQRLDSENYSADIKIAESETLAVVQNDQRIVEWTIRSIPDETPRAAFVNPPSEGRRSVLRLDFQASDDYGLTGLTAVIERPRKDGAADKAAKREVLGLPLPSPGAKLATSASFHDMTPHPWAGLPVDIHLEAKDGAGQVGHSNTVRITLPERKFNHPVAREIIVERRKLIADPGDADLVADALGDIAGQQERYDDDVVVFMGLTLASRRLVAAPSSEAVDVDRIQRLLWDLALRVEDGKLSFAQRGLREAEEALRQALEQNASDAELSRLLNELERALNNYFDELAKMMQETDPKSLKAMPRDPNTLALTRQDFRKIMEEIRKLAQSGSRDAARQMLSQLKNLLETMRTGRMARMSKQGQQSMQFLNDLQKLIQGQQELLDRTFREAQRRGQMRSGESRRPGQMRPGEMQRGPMRPGEAPEGQTQPNGADAQEGLRRQLGELMRRLGEIGGSIPRSMGRAEQSMRRSSRFLESDRPGEAVGPQTQAIDQLQESARSATKQLMQQMGQGIGRRPDEMGRHQDPLGRTPDGAGGMNTSDVGIPEQDALQRAREIRDELRRRAGERNRPETEREYIERLLKQF